MEKQKRSYEFRMSKKVAELTQVVHMLFTRNHEKEVEIEALKEAYELEIKDVIRDAEEKLFALKSEVDDVKTRLGAEGDNIRLMVEGECKLREDNLNLKLADTELLLSSERQECQNIRDLLINAQKDIEHLRQGVAQQLYLKSDQISKRDRDIERLRKEVAQLEKFIRNSDKETSSTLRDFEKNNDNLESELAHMHELLEESHKVKEQQMFKVKTLEAELKMMKKDFSRRVNEAVSIQASKTPRSAPTFMNHSEELEHLRREIQRYRMELSNRDSNFNRVFSSQQPMIVDHRPSRAVSSLSPKPLCREVSNLSNGHPQNSIGQPVLVNGFTKSASRQSRHSSVPHVPFKKANLSNSIYTYYDEFTKSARPNSASSQLPSISSTASSTEGKHNSQRLSKPRPLPKEMLYTK